MAARASCPLGVPRMIISAATTLHRVAAPQGSFDGFALFPSLAVILNDKMAGDY